MKTLKQISTLILLALLINACSPIANLKTATEYDKSVDFKTYNSYKFAKEITYSDTFDNYSHENKRNIENAIHKQLKNKDLEEQELASLEVNFFVIDTHESESITKSSYRNQHYGGMRHLDTYIVEYEQGTLIIDLIDAKSKKLVWRGAATGVITGKQDDMERTIDYAVKKIFSEFPPKL